MAPLIEVSEETLKTLNPEVYQMRDDLVRDLSKSDNFIHVPKLRLYVAKERSLYGKNWFESHKELQSNGERMLTIPEFIEVLKYSKENHTDVYNDITQVRSPWRAEWLDADFKVIDKKLHINYSHVLDSTGNLIPQNSEVLDKNTLMKDKTPGISLDNWLDNSTNQGLPNKKTKSGDLFYWHSRNDNNSVARFDANSGGANLNCGWYPAGRLSDLGVRAVRHE